MNLTSEWLCSADQSKKELRDSSELDHRARQLVSALAAATEPVEAGRPRSASGHVTGIEILDSQRKVDEILGDGMQDVTCFLIPS